MNVQIRQIKGDIVELVFNPKEEDLRVGETLSLREKGLNRGLIIQIIEFRTVTYPALLQEMLELVAETPQANSADLSKLYAAGLSEMSNLKLAIAKIRKVVTWSPSVIAGQL
ncbi:MAG TPA: hypothetical protein PKE45_02390 [Caldilineaceae bacterium]|nr:hypothetical protein [Caldilineaceae bacterium]